MIPASGHSIKGVYLYWEEESLKKKRKKKIQRAEQMPLVRSECLLMTSFTNNKPCNQAGKHTAQQDLSFIPVWQWMEGEKDGGIEGKRGPRRNKETLRQERKKKRERWRKWQLRQNKGKRKIKNEKGEVESKVREPKGAMQSNSTNTVSVWLLNLAKENRLPLFLWVPRGDTGWQDLCPCVTL